jgi:hypothetical protein
MESQVPLHAFSYLYEYGQSDRGISRLETSKYIYGYYDEGTLRNVLLTGRFLDVAKYTTLAPLQLLFLCKLLFGIVGLKISSLPKIGMNPLNNIFIFYLGNYGSNVPGRRRS